MLVNQLSAGLNGQGERGSTCVEQSIACAVLGASGTFRQIAASA
jgi:hypothetical protein